MAMLAACGPQNQDPLISEALRPLPEDLRADATVYRYNVASGEREILREGSNHVECIPRSDDGFTWCYPTSTATRRDLRARLVAEGLSSEEVTDRITAAEAEGSVSPSAVGSMMYRTYDEGDRIQFLWVVVLPDQIATDLAMPTGSQRDASLAGQGTPWMMREGTSGAHLMIPINGTELSNAGSTAPLFDATAITDPVIQATLPLPDDLKSIATVSTFDASTGQRVVLQEGTSTIECRPHDPETGFTRCYHQDGWVSRDMSARLVAEGYSEEDASAAVAEAVEDGTINSTPMGSLGYRLYGEDDRIRLLWVLRVPGATAAELGMPTGSQRDNALAGRGTPWMMNEDTPGAHLMIPINATELSNR
jgi:hypothetical protein